METSSPLSKNTNGLVVVKAGGATGVDHATICQDAAALLNGGERLVIVHGGSAEANRLGEALGSPPRFITSPSGHISRYTNRRTLEIFSMAVNGGVNTALVEELRKVGVNALGLSGVDGGLLIATRKEGIRSIEQGRQVVIRDDFTGKIEAVNSALLVTMLDAGYTPVVSPLAVSREGQALNVDADRAAAMVAAALGAETLLLLTAAPGLLRAFPDESTLIRRLSRAQLPAAMEFAEGRMKKKLLGAEEALNGGVRRVVIADGRVEKPVSRALAGLGTVIE